MKAPHQAETGSGIPGLKRESAGEAARVRVCSAETFRERGGRDDTSPRSSFLLPGGGPPAPCPVQPSLPPRPFSAAGRRAVSPTLRFSPCDLPSGTPSTPGLGWKRAEMQAAKEGRRRPLYEGTPSTRHSLWRTQQNRRAETQGKGKMLPTDQPANLSIHCQRDASQRAQEGSHLTPVRTWAHQTPNSQPKGHGPCHTATPLPSPPPALPAPSSLPHLPHLGPKYHCPLSDLLNRGPEEVLGQIPRYP